MPTFKIVMRWALGVLFIVAGVFHFYNPDFYLRIMPPYLPWHLELVYLSGFAEALLGALVLLPRCAPLAGWGLIALLVAVFPANLHMAVNAHLYPEFRAVGLWLRLPLQGVLIIWVYWCTRTERLPRT